ncbi:F-box/FBD/LRR-repeat protein-like protein, partial [Tanacetum coccineum]
MLTERRKFFYAICQVLVMHEVQLHEFSVSMFPDELCFIDDECVEMDALIFHLSRKNTVKKLTIDFGYDTYMLPFSIFSFHHLTDLSLVGCFFHQPTFSGFGSLTSLSLDSVYISKQILLRLLSNCPMLKTLTLVTDNSFIGSDSPVESPTIIN